MKMLFIDPTDVLLFRDGRSFSAATEDNLAVGYFPPYPTSVYGALRSVLLSEAGAAFDRLDFDLGDAVLQDGTPLQEIVGTKRELGTLAIRSFALARLHQGETLRDGRPLRATRLFPIPFDILCEKDSLPDPSEKKEKPLEHAHASFLVPRPDATGRTNLPKDLDLLWLQNEMNGENNSASGSDAVYTNANGYLPEPAFRMLLKGDPDGLKDGISPSALFKEEPRTSVSIEGDTQTGKEGRLFTVGFARTAPDVGLAVSLTPEAATPSGVGWLRLGGEARSARYSTCVMSPPSRPVSSSTDDAEISSSMAEAIRSNEGCFKLVLTTPAVFQNGWLPNFISEDRSGIFAGCNVTLRSAAVASHVHVGGWDIAAGRPKRTHRAVPAGSVYFFQLDDPSDASRLPSDQTPTSLYPADTQKSQSFRRQGLGLAYLGTYAALDRDG